MTWQDFITSDANVLAGRPVVRGLVWRRISCSDVSLLARPTNKY